MKRAIEPSLIGIDLKPTESGLGAMVGISSKILRGFAFVAALMTNIMLGPSTAWADSELQKFLASLPSAPGWSARLDRPGAPGDLHFSAIPTCQILAQSQFKRKNKNATFEEIEEAISKDQDCERGYLEANKSLAKAGLNAEQRLATIRRYKLLAAAERRLQFDGKPIPGYRAPPDDGVVTAIIAWERRFNAALSTYRSCVDEALKGLIPFSDDPSDVVADAAIGICSNRRGEFRSVVREEIKNDEVSDKVDRNLRSSALGKVAAARAEMRRREMLRQQAPQTNQPSTERQKTGI